MGADRKYGRVTTEHEEIPDDEPVVVLRGQDMAVPQALDAYVMACQWAGSPPSHVALATETASQIRLWQATHPERVIAPTSQAYFDRA